MPRSESMAERMAKGPRAQLEQMSAVERQREGPHDTVARLREAIRAHRDRWYSANGANSAEARPADLELWAVLDV